MYCYPTPQCEDKPDYRTYGSTFTRKQERRSKTELVLMVIVTMLALTCLGIEIASCEGINDDMIGGLYQVQCHGGLNARSGPGTEFEVVDVLDRAQNVFVLEAQGEWVRVGVNYSSRYPIGWVKAEYIRRKTK